MIVDILISFVTSLAALIVALYIERKREPLIEITVGETANHDETYHVMGRYKFFRAQVRNRPFPHIFSWLPRRYMAQNCTAEILFIPKGVQKELFSMKGRWASTPELAYLPKDQLYLKILLPDPASIVPGKTELLDLFAKPENDANAYGWNNESYTPGDNHWRTPRCTLTVGDYSVRIILRTQNGVEVTKEFDCHIANSIEDTRLT